MILDPRHFRIDDLLRRPYTPTTPFGPSGDHLWAGTPPWGWGFRQDVHWVRRTTDTGLAPYTLRIFADEREVEPADGLHRPSHATLHARDDETGLQVTEDKFITQDDVAVSVLSLRNPEEIGIDIRVDLRYGVKAGEHHFLPDGDPVYVHREGPPGDNLRQMLHGGARQTLVVAVAFAPAEAEAVLRAARWARAASPVREQAEAYQAWFTKHVPLFDCPDPWLTKLWYHGWHLVRKQSTQAQIPPLPGGNRHWAALGDGAAQADQLFSAVRSWAMDQFEDGDYARPRESALAGVWLEALVGGVVGLASCGGGAATSLPVRPHVPRAGDGGWPHFCLENVACAGRRLTVVWDDPESPGDVYDDGDKGLTVYVDGRRAHHQQGLASFTAPLPQEDLSQD